MKNRITEMKNTLGRINNTLDDAEEWIRNPEDRIVEITNLNRKR